MTSSPRTFGTELRRLRQEKGLSLREFGALIHYSKGHLSKIESGLRPVSVEFARRCDAALGAGGALAAVVEQHAPPAADEHALAEPAGWLFAFNPQGGVIMVPVDRRTLLALGVASALGTRVVSPDAGGIEQTVPGWNRLLDEYFLPLGRTVRPDVVLPPLVAQVQVIQAAAGRAGAGQRAAVLQVGARYAEYIGWMFQEAGDEQSAIWWTDHAAALAIAAGDQNMPAYALTRKSLIAYYRGDRRTAVMLAGAAENYRGPVSPGVRARIALQAAEAHALGGDTSACLRSLDRSRELFSDAAADPDREPPLGPAALPGLTDIVNGWCHLDLGRPEQAADILLTQTEQITGSSRARALHSVRLAVAQALVGEMGTACATAETVLDAAVATGSATTRRELRRLSRVLRRWPRSEPVLRTQAHMHRVIAGLPVATVQ